MAMNGPRIFFITAGLGFLLGGCEPAPAHRVQVHQDLGSTSGDVGGQDAFFDDVQDAQADRTSDAMRTGADHVDCVLDADCGELGVCDPTGRCTPADVPFLPTHCRWFESCWGCELQYRRIF